MAADKTVWRFEAADEGEAKGAAAVGKAPKTGDTTLRALPGRPIYTGIACY